MHHIKRLEVELRAPDQQQARDLQQQVSTFCRTELHEVLQEAFDLAAPDRYLRIDRLELTLPAFRDVADFRNKVTERLRQELGLQLAEAKDVKAAAARARAGPLTGEQAAPDTAAVSFGLPYQAADVFLHILQYGSAPWHAMSTKYDELVDEVIELLQTEHSFRLHLTTIFAASDQVLQRFILQTPAPARHRILAGITGHDQGLIVTIERFIESFVHTLCNNSDLTDNALLLAREITCRNMLHQGSIEDSVFPGLLKELIEKMATSAGAQAHRILSALPLAEMESETVLPKRFRAAFHNILASFLQPADSRASADSSPNAGNSPEKKMKESVDGQEHIQGDKPETGISVESNRAETEASVQSDRPETDLSIQNDSSEAETSVTRGKPETKTSAEDDRPTTVLASEATPATENILPEGTEQLVLERQEKTHRDGESGQPEGSAPGEDDAQQELEGLGETREVPGNAGECRESRKTEQNLTTSAPRPDQAAGFPWMTRHETEEFHINNAGLVLLAPFFGLVFKDLGYVDQKRGFASEELRIRAVHFSQFLVTAEQHAPEAGLALNKVLCGMEVGKAMERFVDLSLKEQSAAQEVIDSALMHWSALKRTSAPVFRQTFLKHEGILTFQGGNWLLRIERTSVDILLDTLPWTISIIKHPWMKQPVMVEW